MDWDQKSNGEFGLTVPESVATWDAVRPYFAAGWEKVLSSLPPDKVRPKPPTVLLCIDGRYGIGRVWMVWVGEPGSAAVNLEVMATEVLVAGQEDWNAANCRFAREVLRAVAEEPAATAARAVVAVALKAAVRHDAIDPEHGWYNPFQATLANLLKRKVPKIEWTYDFDEE